MTVKTGSAWAGSFVTLDATGALSASADASGVLYVDGVANAASVTITGSNPYKWSVTLPSLTAGQRVDMYITGTIATIATAGFVASDQADTALVSEVKTDTAAIQADLDNPAQYKADVSGLATTTHVQEVEDKIDAIDTQAVMSYVIDGFTFEQIVQIMAASLAGRLTRAGDTLRFRDLADTVDRIIAQTDANKQRTDMTYTV